MCGSAGCVGGDESIRPERRHRVGRVLAPALLSLALGVAAAPSLAGATTNQQVGTANISGVGRVLTVGHRVLYVHSTDTRRHSTCTGSCATFWPPFLVSRQAVHHLGHVKGLGTIRRPNGKLQVTINGHPLYFFAGDKNLTAMGQGFQNMWFTVRANGTAVHVASANSAPAAPVAPAPAPAPTSTSTTQGSHSSRTPTPAPAPTTTPPTSPPAAPTTTPPTSPPVTTTTSPPPTTTTTAPGGGGVGF